MKTSLAGLLIAALALGAAAQEGAESGGSPFQGKRFIEHLEKSLKLKEDQKKKIEAIVEKSQARDKKKVEELKKLRERMKSLGKELHRSNQETREAIREQLDLDQRERFDAMMQKLKRGRRGRGGGGEGGMQRGQPREGGGGRMRGIDVDPSELPPELREKMGGHERQFPPEMWHRGDEDRERDDLPPEIRERIRERMERRQRQGEGTQRDVPPPEQWHDGSAPGRDDAD